MAETDDNQMVSNPMPHCTCWFNKHGELIYVESACPQHGGIYEHNQQG